MEWQRETLAQVNQPIRAQGKVLGMTCEKLTGAPCLLIQLCETFPRAAAAIPLSCLHSLIDQHSSTNRDGGDGVRAGVKTEQGGKPHVNIFHHSLPHYSAALPFRPQTYKITRLSPKSWPETNSSLNGCAVFKCWADWNLLWNQTCAFKPPFSLQTQTIYELQWTLFRSPERILIQQGGKSSFWYEVEGSFSV